LEKGDVDVAWNLLPDQILDVKESPRVNILTGSGFHLFYMGMKVKLLEPLGDERVEMPSAGPLLLQ
jgi:hypothetical protein